MADLEYKKYAFDPHGDNPANDIVGETHDLKGYDCPYIIPNGAPFKADSVKIKTDEGQNVTTGWKEVFKPIPLIDATGLDMNMFIELSDDLLERYKEGKLVISYHTVGVKFIPANNLKDQLWMIEHGNKPIPWRKIIQLPPDFPAEFHIHAIEEFVDWSDLVYFVRYLCGMYERKNAVGYTQLHSTFVNTMTALKNGYSTMSTKQDLHLFNYSNPHEINPTHLLLGNLGNFATATVAEDVVGVRADLYSTPAGALAAIKAANPDLSDIVRNGAFPITYYKSNGFLPPNIDGSFEAIGRNSDTFFLVEENDGTINMLANHYDGRTNGLYIDQMKAPIWDSSIRYLGVEYKHPAFNNLTTKPIVATGSTGGEILIVGNRTNFNDWMITRTNGTLDPNSHRYAKLDMSEVQAFHNNPITVFRDMKVQYMGKWVYIFLTGGWGGIGSTGSIALFRLATADIIDGATVKFTKVNVNYTDMDQITKTNQPYINLLTPVVENGILKKFHWTYENMNITIGDGFLRNTRIFSAPVPDTNNERFVIQFSGMFRHRWIDSSGLAKLPGAILELISEFNPETNTLSFIASTPIRNVNTEPGNWGSDTQEISALHWGPQFEGTYITRDGTYLGGTHPDPQVFPFSLYLMRYPDAKTPYDTVMKLSSRTVNTPVTKQNGTLIETPTLNGMYQLGTIWDGKDEIFKSQMKNGVPYRYFYRKVSGGYQQRTNNKLLDYPTAMSRSLSADIYNLEVFDQTAMLSVTGTAAELNAAGIEMGDLGLGVIVVNPDGSRVNRNEYQWPTNKDGVYATLPRSFNRVFDETQRTVKFEVTDYFGLTAADIETLYTMIMGTTEYVKRGMCIKIFPDTQSPLSRKLGFMLINTIYVSLDGRTRTHSYMTVRFTLEAKQPATPNVTMLKNLQKLDVKSIDYFDSIPTTLPDQIGWHSYIHSAYTSVYIDGNKAIVYDNGPLAIGMINTAPSLPIMLFDIDITTGAMTQPVNQAGKTAWISADVYIAIPTVGPSQILDYLGGAGTVMRTRNGDLNRRVLVSSVYPEVGWVVYFRDGVSYVIHGTEYAMPTGSIDLRDVDADPTNKTFYIYTTIQSDEPAYVVSADRLRHNLGLVPVVKLTTNESQILTIERYQSFIIGDGLVTTERQPGSIPLSAGVPMEEGAFVFTRQVDYPRN